MRPNNFVLFVVAGLLGFAVLALPSCEHNAVEPTDTEPQSSFFPLAVGNWWEYEVTKAACLDSTYRENLGFRIEIVGRTTLKEKSYFLIQEFGLPTAGFPDTLMLRADNNKVYAYLAGQDRILYDFTPATDSLWQVPYLLRPSDFPETWVHCIHQTESNRDTTKFRWEFNCDAGDEAPWDEYFIIRKGLVKIFLVSQALCEVTWNLSDYNINASK